MTRFRTDIRTRVARATVALAAFAALMVLCACGQSSSNNTGGTKPSSHNLADVVFATHMTPHHQQGADLAAMVPAHTGNPDLIKLASGITSTQMSEIKMLADMVTQWSTQPDTDTRGPADTAMTGMVDEATLTKLGTLNGPDFDKLWLQSMISHHQGAVDMANTEVGKGNNPDAIAMAKKMAG
ncbi:MAG TPA: DUF305 domain-containing protein, partial [Mycobacterium sp.]|nr:DUF305 domain-containing protein [Mycobacterium sp.]